MLNYVLKRETKKKFSFETQNTIGSYFTNIANGLRLDEISALPGESISQAYNAIGASYGYDFQQAYLGYESFKHDGRGAFISYWKDMDAVRAWATEPKHIEAKKLGQSQWYKYYHSVIAEVKTMHVHGG